MSPCCLSPQHLASSHPLAEAALAIALVMAAAWIVNAVWTWLNSPLGRHACAVCEFGACGYCQREDRDARVDSYARAARERAAARSAFKNSLSEREKP